MNKTFTSAPEMGLELIKHIGNRDTKELYVAKMQYLQGIKFTARPSIARILVEFEEAVGSSVNNNWTRQIGPFSGCIKAGEYDLKPNLFSPRIMAMMSRVHIFIKDGKKKGSPVYKNLRPSNPNPQFLEVEKLAKTLMFMRNQSLQNDLIARMDTLEAFPYYHLLMEYVPSTSELKPLAADLIKDWIFENPMNPKHVLQGFFPSAMDMKGLLNTPVYIQDGKMIWTCEAMKKAVARHKLAHSQSSVQIPEGFKVIILDDLPEDHIHKHVLGGAYMHPNMVKKYGVSRMTNQYLAKCVTVPVDTEVIVELQEFGDRFMVIGKNAFKGHLNGVLQAMKQAKPGVELEGAEQIEQYRRTFNMFGTEVSGFLIDDMKMEITNLYTAYGWKLSDEVKAAPATFVKKYEEGHPLHRFSSFIHRQSVYGNLDISDVNSDDEDAQQTESVYLHCLSEIEVDNAFSVCDFLRYAEEEGLIVRSGESTNVKASDLMNVYYSYGPMMARKFMQSVASSKVVDPATIELNQYLLGNLQTLEIDTTVINKMVNLLWTDDRRKNIGSKVDKNSSVEWAKLVDFYFYGGKTWDGLIGEHSQPKHFTVKGHKFYIPGRLVLDRFIFEQNDIYGNPTGIILQGKPGYRIAELFSFIYKYGSLELIPVDELKVIHAWYHSHLQADLYDLYGNSFKVKGFANKVALPRYWSSHNTHEIYCTDRRYRQYDGATVCMSKIPVLFDKAMHGAIWHSKFGNLFQKDTVLEFALSCAVFVSPDVFLAHQNDCDGDLVRVMFDVEPLPYFHGYKDLESYMHAWAKNYIDGEYAMKMEFKGYKRSDIKTLDAAIRESVMSERAVGVATNFMNGIGLLGTDMDFDLFKEVRNRHSMLVQRVVSGMKHAGVDADKFLAFMSKASVSAFASGSPTVVQEVMENYMTYLEHPKPEAVSTAILSKYTHSVYERFLTADKIYTKIEHAQDGDLSFSYDEGSDLPFIHMGMYTRTHASRISKLLPYPRNYKPVALRDENEHDQWANQFYDVMLADYGTFQKKYVLFASGLAECKNKDSFLGMMQDLMLNYGVN